MGCPFLLRLYFVSAVDREMISKSRLENTYPELLSLRALQRLVKMAKVFFQMSKLAGSVVKSQTVGAASPQATSCLH